MDDLTCPICLEVLSDPVMLPRCGHSLCRACLLNMSTESPNCPICRIKHEGTPLDKLPTNYIVAALARQQSEGESSADQVPSNEGRPKLRKNSFGVLVIDTDPYLRVPTIEQPQQVRPISTHLPFSYGGSSANSQPGQRPISFQINDANNDPSEANAVDYRRPNQPGRQRITQSIQLPNIVRVNQERPFSMQSLSNRDIASARTHHSTINEESPGVEGPGTPILPTAPPMSVYADPELSSLDGIANEACDSHGEISISVTDKANPKRRVILTSRSISEDTQNTDLFHEDGPTSDRQMSTRMGNKQGSARFCWFSFKQCVAGAIMGLTYLYFFTSYSWMIKFAIFKEGYNKEFEKEYLLTTGICGLPKITHLSARIIYGGTSCLEKFFFILYYIFDISMVAVGIFKYIDCECKFEVLLFANSPFVVILGFTAIAFILSITSAPLTPNLKASSGFTTFWGYCFFFLSVLACIGIYVMMSIYGYTRESTNDKIFLLTYGVFGIWTIGHCMFYLIGNGNSLCQKISRISFLFYILVWVTLGIITYLQIFPVETLTYWIVNAPVMIKAGLSLLIWSLRVVTKKPRNEDEEISAADDIPPHWIS